MARYRRRKASKKGKVKSALLFIIFSVMSATGVVKYYDQLKPLFNMGAGFIADFITAPAPLLGNIVRVSDGDTLVMLNESGVEIKVRLYGIDAPESAQQYGAKSHNALESLVMNRNVSVSVINIDRYGRSVGIVSAGDTNVNEAMLASGNAWYYSNYCDKFFCQRWAVLADEARKNKLGLWKQPNPTPPWDYRHDR